MSKRPFRTAVPFYTRYRLAYPPELLDAMAENCRLDGAGRLLDLGCGPGYLAIPLARHFAETVAMDPEPKMMEAARRAAARAGVPLTFVQASSAELGAHLGSFRMVAIGRAFDWIDREATLACLDRLVEPEGCIAVVEDVHPDVAENSWVGIWREVRDRWGAGRERSERWQAAIPSLEVSPFSRVDIVGVKFLRPLSVNEVIGRSYSLSGSSPAVIGANRAAFEAELRNRLLALHPTGKFQEFVAMRALVARRPLPDAADGPA